MWLALAAAHIDSLPAVHGLFVIKRVWQIVFDRSFLIDRLLFH
jgi:hypothetical protein